jgi:hypothetical protein
MQGRIRELEAENRVKDEQIAVLRNELDMLGWEAER